MFASGQSLQRDCVKFMTFYAFYLEENQTQNEFLSLSQQQLPLGLFWPRPFLDKQNRQTAGQEGGREVGRNRRLVVMAPF